jgi:hypothetical protein
VDTFQGGLQFYLSKISRRMVPEQSEPPLSLPQQDSPFSQWLLQNVKEISPPPTAILHLENASIALASHTTTIVGTKMTSTAWRIHSNKQCIWMNAQ